METVQTAPVGNGDGDADGMGNGDGDADGRASSSIESAASHGGCSIASTTTRDTPALLRVVCNALRLENMPAIRAPTLSNTCRFGTVTVAVMSAWVVAQEVASRWPQSTQSVHATQSS